MVQMPGTIVAGQQNPWPLSSEPSDGEDNAGEDADFPLGKLIDVNAAASAIRRVPVSQEQSLGR